MATYNNRHWLLSHIRNSFISTDDTGMCENVMLSEDIPSQFITGYPSAASTIITDKGAFVNKETDDNYVCYPGLDQSDDEDGFVMAHSYDILMSNEVGFYRQRSNTAQNLEKMKMARVKASRIRSVKVDDRALEPVAPAEAEEFFTKRLVAPTHGEERRSRLSETLRVCPKQTQNKFVEYARFDGTAQTNMSTRSMRIFLTMLPESLRNYPMTVVVTATAKIQEFIGLICYKCSIANPEVPLKSVRNYGLYITEEDGEVDTDFPPLDVREPCSKFCFSQLALMERKHPIVTMASSAVNPAAARDPIGHIFEHPLTNFRTLSMTSEMESIRNQALISDAIAKKQNLMQQQTRDLATMLDHTTMMEAPLYRSYRVHMLAMSSFYKTEIQLGISGEKIEIDPVQPKGTSFWPKQKAISHNITSIACCEIVELKSSHRAIFRIIYNADMIAAGPGAAANTNAAQLYEAKQMSAVGTGIGATDLMATTTNANAVGLNGGTPMFKHYSFETDHKTAQEIVEKVKNILEVRSSMTRTVFLSFREKRLRRKHRPKTNI